MAEARRPVEEKQIQRIVTIVKIGIVALVSWWAFHSCASGSSSTFTGPSRTQPSAADLRAKRQEAQAFWQSVISKLGVAGAGLEYAAKDVQEGDMVSAQQLLAASEKIADAASKASLTDPPDDDAWQGIGGNLYSASNLYKKAIQETRDGIATDNSEQEADALNDTEEANDDLSQATHDARVWYMQNGGKSSDIEDGEHAKADAAEILKTVSN
jgi:hypothetical protein